MAFAVYFLQFFPVETQCLRLDLHPRLRLGLHLRLRSGLHLCLRSDLHARLPLCLKSFKKEIQGTKMSGNETQENEMQKNKTQGSEIQGNKIKGNETQALRLYKSQFLIFTTRKKYK